MAELSSTSKIWLWSTLKKRIGDAKKKKKTSKKKQNVNPFASQGLEKFALLMADLQAKKTSLVDKTGNSVSAARYLSRSAQEWTATTLARTASRCREREPPKASSSEVLLLQQSSPSPNIHSKERIDVETIDFSHSLSFQDPRHGVLLPQETNDGSYGFASEALVVGDLQRETNLTSVSLGEKTDESRESRGDADVEESEVGCSGLPAKSERLIRNGRLLLLQKGWTRLPKSAIALLVALGAYVGGRVAKIGNLFFEALTISLVVRWQKGKVYAEVLQALVARHVMPHLSIRVPTRLASLPLVGRKVSKEPDVNTQVSDSRIEEQLDSEIECVHGRNSSFAFPVFAEGSSPSSPASDCAPISALPMSPVSNPLAVPNVSTSSPTRRLMKKISSKLKLKISRSSSWSSRDKSASTSTSSSFMSSAPVSPLPSATSGGSSPRRNSTSSFSHRDKDKAMLQDEEILAESSPSGSPRRRCCLTKKCSFRKEKTPESSTGRASTSRKSPLGRASSSNAMDHTSSTEATSGLHDVTTRYSQKDLDLWLIAGLLVALLFLLVGRFSAIVATSLLFLVLAHSHKESRMRRQSLGTARKLQKSGRLGSPSR